MPQCNLDKCGEKRAPVATFVANVFITLNNYIKKLIVGKCLTAQFPTAK